MKTKVRAYEALVLSVMLYNSETWTMNNRDEYKIRAFEMFVLRKIYGVSLRDKWRMMRSRRCLKLNATWWREYGGGGFHTFGILT